MRIAMLSSGSKGNATLIQTKTHLILLDCGISRRALMTKMAELGVSLDALDAVILSHEHDDHTRGLKQLLKHQTPLLLSHAMTLEHLNGVVPSLQEPLTPGVKTMLGSLEILPFQVSHDAVAPLGFKLTEEGRSMVHITDTGFIPQTAHAPLSNAEVYVMESNYDAGLLYASPRPHHLKKRIDSVKGHLSNLDAAYHLAHMVGPSTHSVIFAHLSEDCNTPSHTLETFYEVFQDYALSTQAVQTYCASAKVVTPCIHV